MVLQRLKELLVYDPVTGVIQNKKSKRQMQQDEYGFIVVYDNNLKKRSKIKAAKVAWELGNDKELPKDKRIIHKNLIETDTKLANLGLITRNQYRQLQEAIRNLGGNVRLLPHPEDQFSYIIRYQLNGKEKREVRYDIGAASSKYLQLQLKFAKILNKYCLFD